MNQFGKLIREIRENNKLPLRVVAMKLKIVISNMIIDFN